MRKWGTNSKERLNTCTVEVQWLMSMVLQGVADVSVLEGHRNEERQNSLYPVFTKVQWPNGKHNKFPSEAVDFQPYPRPDTEKKLISALSYIAGAAVEIGEKRGLIVRWGGDWDCDGDLTDQNFDDLFHIEVRRAEVFDPFTVSELAWLRNLGLNCGVPA